MGRFTAARLCVCMNSGWDLCGSLADWNQSWGVGCFRLSAISQAKFDDWKYI